MILHIPIVTSKNGRESNSLLIPTVFKGVFTAAWYPVVKLAND
jgi:hypothetical protein